MLRFTQPHDIITQINNPFPRYYSIPFAWAPANTMGWARTHQLPGMSVSLKLSKWSDKFFHLPVRLVNRKILRVLALLWKFLCRNPIRKMRFGIYWVPCRHIIGVKAQQIFRICGQCSFRVSKLIAKRRATFLIFHLFACCLRSTVGLAAGGFYTSEYSRKSHS